MIRHRIYVRHDGVPPEDRLDVAGIKRVIRLTLELEKVTVPCEISVLICADEAIRGINRRFREMDRVTDVLSFPMQSLAPGGFSPDDVTASPETGLVPLGDIVLSAPRVGAQAEEYGQARAREAEYLTIHSVLHLLGYDHTGAAEKAGMRERERAALREAGYEEQL